jgi:hypothetical protein
MDEKRVLTVVAITAALAIPTVAIAAAQSAYEPVEAEVLAASYEGNAQENAPRNGQGGRSGQGGMMGGHGKGGGQGGGMAMGTEPAGTLSDELKGQLVYLAEEEKVAHDLYVLADNTYGSDTNVYGNISQAETRHFTAMNRLLDLYGLDSATKMGEAGNFDDPKLQLAYDSLAEEIAKSAEAAAAVGVEAENTDIADLKNGLAMDSVPSDVARVLSNLVRASENHLSAFTNLQNQL